MFETRHCISFRNHASIVNNHSIIHVLWSFKRVGMKAKRSTNYNFCSFEYFLNLKLGILFFRIYIDPKLFVEIWPICALSKSHNFEKFCKGGQQVENVVAPVWSWWNNQNLLGCWNFFNLLEFKLNKSVSIRSFSVIVVIRVHANLIVNDLVPRLMPGKLLF